MYGTDNDLEINELVKKKVQFYERDSIYKELQTHMNIIYTLQFSLALGFAFLIQLQYIFYNSIWAFDELRTYMMEHPAYLILSCASFILIIVAVRFFFFTIRDFPLNYFSLFLFSLSKIYLLGFIFCIAYFNLYVFSLALICIDFFIIASLNIAKFTNIFLIMSIIVGDKIIASIVLGLFFSILESFLMVLITGAVSIIYQFTIYAITKKQKFGLKDFSISTLYLYSFWLMPFGPDDA